jgi:endo-1,4-beta-xylanase
MKSGPIQPAEGEFDFELADQFVAQGAEKGMYTVGHCLVWHSQAPPWFFTDAEGSEVSREVLIERMKDHIFTVAGRYKGKVDAWDVVNEAFLDDGSWRETPYYRIIGEDYMELAFQFAYEADPGAQLLYNDYSLYLEDKREAVIRLVRDFQETGIPIHGVGMQAHYGLDYPTLEEFEESILGFAETGVEVHITELDISVLPNPFANAGAEISDRAEYAAYMNPYPNGLPDSVATLMNQRWMDFFNLFLDQEEKIRRVTTWGVADPHSWKNNWPINGRTDYPLLFDRAFQPKPVVEKIIKSAQP